jgi:hypothetical protein
LRILEGISRAGDGFSSGLLSSDLLSTGLLVRLDLRAAIVNVSLLQLAPIDGARCCRPPLHQATIIRATSACSA